MKISLIAAVATDWSIGRDNDLMWHLPADMKYFKEKTEGHCILTGRKNYFSIPDRFRPLKNRTNLIVSRSKDIKAEEDVRVFNSIKEAVSFAYEFSEDELFIIGGGEIYKQTIDMADKLYITEVHSNFPDAHVHFPQISKNHWQEVSREKHLKDDKHQYDFDFVVYERR